jgi:hypothetical protein
VVQHSLRTVPKAQLRFAGCFLAKVRNWAMEKKRSHPRTPAQPNASITDNGKAVPCCVRDWSRAVLLTRRAAAHGPLVASRVGLASLESERAMRTISPLRSRQRPIV